MWKCIHRGLRTSANLLKTDQSNGGCIVSSVISKDFDELSSHPNDLCSSACVDDGILPTVSNRKSIVDRSHESREDYSSVEPHAGDEVPNTSFIVTNIQSKATTNNPDLFALNYQEASCGDLVCCRKCHKVYRNAPESMCFSQLHNRSWISKKLYFHYPCNISSSTSATWSGFLNHSTLRPHILPEDKSLSQNSGITRKFESSVKIHDPPSTISFLQPYHSEKKKKLAEYISRKGPLAKERSLTCHNFTSCLLKLPFLSYDFMKSRGLNQLYECMVNKGKTEFKGDGNKGQKREKSQESEEARKESWKRHQAQHSLVEAIGLSSALLLGWFLVQFRIWHPCGERRNIEHQRRIHGTRCGMFSRLTFPSVRNSHQPLNAVPSQESNGKLVTERQNTSKDANKNSVNSEKDCSVDYLSVLFNLDDLQEKSLSNNFASSLVKKKISGDAEGNWKQEVHPVTVEVNEKEPFPMPWYPQESKQFGPITLEQAIDEAGKSLEEAHAEVLLHIALEKLEGGEESGDESSAVDLLTRAAHLGSSIAAFNLGICYEMGVGGISKDLSKAYYWYKVASDGGHAGAMYNMAIYHAQGLAGLSVDTKLARQLLERASSFELPEARDALALLTSLKPTDTADLPQNDSIVASNHIISKSSSQLLLKDKDSDVSLKSNSDNLGSKKTGTSHNKIPKNLDVSLSHMMTESLLSSLMSDDDLHPEITLENAQNTKQSDLKYISAIALAH